MMSALVEPRGWPAGRWWLAVAFVFALQVALALVLEDRSPPPPRQPGAAPVFRWSDNRSGEWLALEDPTLFALPHRQGFSGEAWLRIPSLDFRPDDWSEPARFMPLPEPELGAGFRNFVQTNPAPPFPSLVMIEPELMTPEYLPMPPVSTPSRLRIEGDLAKWRLLSRPSLPSWTCTDRLTNNAVLLLVDAQGNAYLDLLNPSVVQLIVDAQGRTVSAVLLPPGSGFKGADQRALELARTARFAAAAQTLPGPAKNPPADLTIGTMVFDWQTLPAPSPDAPQMIP